MTACPDIGQIVEAEIDRVATQYRESTKLLALMRAYLGQVEDVVRVVCSIPSFFDLDTAVGDQLTLLGKRLGFPRCHCGCVMPPVIGFACEGAYEGPYTLVGACEGGSLLSCRETGSSTICIDDDEQYRAILKARRYQMIGLYDIDSLNAAAQTVWGPAASAHNQGGGVVVVAPGRALSADETLLRSIVFRALPIAPGVKAMTSDAAGPIVGFGDGWGGACDGSEILCPIDPLTYDCP